MASSDYTPNFAISNFLGGVNEGVDASIVKYNEAVKAQNCDIDYGTLLTKKGSTLYKSFSTLTRIGTIMPYYKDDVVTLLIGSENKIYKVNADDSLTVLAEHYTSDVFDYLNVKIKDTECLIFCNGTDPMKYYDGNVIRDVKNRMPVYDKSGNIAYYIDGNGVKKTNESDVTTLAPKGRFVELHYERVWTAKDNMVYFSTANTKGFDPEDWTTPTNEEDANQHGGYVDMITNDGSKIVGLKVIFDDVLIFKNKSVFKIFGTYPAEYTKSQLFTASGAIADKSIVSGDGKAYFLSRDGIYQYNGTNVVPIHEKIRDTFNNLNKDALDKSVGVWFKGKYILAVPEGTSTVNNLIIEFNPTIGSYMLIRGATVNSFVDFKDKLLFSDNSGNVYEYNIGTTFNGSPVTMFWETGINSKYQNAIKNIDSMYFIGSGNGKVKITCITERATRSTVVNLTASDLPYKPKLKNKGRVMRFRFENVDGSSINIKSPQALLELDFD
jgi:hypothetical protein